MNDMTDFDKLIKEKAEQASYPYDKAAWKQYKRKTGLHAGAAKYWVAGAASIAAVGTFLLFKQGHQAPPPSQPSQTVTTAADSGSAMLNTSIEVAEDTLAIQEIQAAPKRVHPVPQKNTGKTAEQTPGLLKDTSKVVRKVISGKPIVIDVDTITRMVPTDAELEKGHSRLF